MNFSSDKFKFASRFIQSTKKGLLFPGEGKIEVAASVISPQKKDASGAIYETSVYVHEDANDIPWEVGAKMFKVDGTDAEKKVPVASIELPCQELEGLGLTVKIEKNDYSENHANIVGWSDDSDRRDIEAAELLRKGKVVLRPERENELYEKARRVKPRSGVTAK